MPQIPRSKFKNCTPTLHGEHQANGSISMGAEQWCAAILMDIRDELQALNRVMQCPNVQRGFRAMERMDRRLAKEVKLRDRGS